MLLGAIAFASMLCEGATADWASVYLSGPLHATGVVPGLGYAAFSLAMVTVRLSGNRLLTRYRPDRLLPALAAVATHRLRRRAADRPTGCRAGRLRLPGHRTRLGRAGRVQRRRTHPGLHPGTAVATASACGWAGFVCGPPLIGQLASLTSLPAALGLLPLLTAFIVVGTSLARALKAQPQHHGRPASAGLTR